MTFTDFEYFQTLYEVNYNSITGVATVSSGNLNPGPLNYTSLSIAPGNTEMMIGDSGTIVTETISNSGVATQGSSKTQSGSFTYEGTVSDGGQVVGVLILSNGNYYVASVYENGYTTGFVNGTTVLTVNTSQNWDLNGTNYTTPSTYTENGNPTPACFMAGTMITTPDGETQVELLRAGDLVVLSDGRVAPISWLGRQSVSLLFANSLKVTPVRIKAGALADGVPARDLLLSPDHAVLVDGVLIHACALVNGVTIVRDKDVPVNFTYYHVEVADHSLILAENTPAETFIDNVDRMAFDNWNEHPGNAPLVEMDLPRAKSTRQVPAATAARLAARATALFGAQAIAA
jgi:hypothetical protein